MNLRKLRETIPLLITFGAVLVIGVLFFSFAKAEAALEITFPDNPDTIIAADDTASDDADDADDDAENNDEAANDPAADSESAGTEETDLPQPPDVIVSPIDAPNLTKTAAADLTEYSETYFQAGDDIELSGIFDNDVIVTGRSITITGEVNGDVIAAAADVTITAPVHGNVRVAAGTVTISGDVARNVTVFTGDFTLSDTATVQRDLYVQADQVQLDGIVNGTVRGGANTMNLTGTVRGNVNLENVTTLNVSSQAHIDGDLLYSAPNEEWVIINGTVGGETVSSPPLVKPEAERSKFTTWFVVRKILAWLGALLVGLVFTLLLPKRSRGIVQHMIASPGRSIAWGAVYVLGTLCVVTLLLFTIIGIPLSIIGVLLFGISMYVAKIMVGMALGRLILPKTKSLFAPMALGLTLYYAVMSMLDLLNFPWSWLVSGINIMVIVWAAGGGVLNFRSNRQLAKAQSARTPTVVRKRIAPKNSTHQSSRATVKS